MQPAARPLAWLIVLVSMATWVPTGTTDAASGCPDGNWTQRDSSCYRWFTTPNFWYIAEQTCASHGGHLVSVGSHQENRLVGRLSNCTQAWIGRFGTDLKRLSDPRSYSWSDASSAGQFHRHNFTQLDSFHKPLIRTDGEWWLNSLYHESHPFVCEVSARVVSDGNRNADCPDGWSLFQQHCYTIPSLEANFNEANFYCQRKSSQLVSVMSEAELNFISTLDLGSDKCETSLGTIWIGLIKLNPCFPDNGGRELCYQWTDFSGKHTGFPRWESGHPNSADWTVNCVTLRGDRLQSDRCHSRHRFACKAPATDDTEPAEMLAAFNFRSGLQNLVSNTTYRVYDDFRLSRSPDAGACFNSRQYYRIGEVTSVQDTIMAERQWTMFFRIRVKINESMDGDNISPVAVGRELYGWHFYEFPLVVNASYSALHPQVEAAVHLRNVTGWQESKFYVNITSHRRDEWNDYVITTTDLQPAVIVNGETFGPYRNYTSTGRPIPPDRNKKMYFGNIVDEDYHWWRQTSTVCAKCFGLARKRLSQRELRKVFTLYCD